LKSTKKLRDLGLIRGDKTESVPTQIGYRQDEPRIIGRAASEELQFLDSTAPIVLLRTIRVVVMAIGWVCVSGVLRLGIDMCGAPQELQSRDCGESAVGHERHPKEHQRRHPHGLPALHGPKHSQKPPVVHREVCRNRLDQPPGTVD
jgi:hypothetical protein